MRDISITELRKNANRYFDLVESGEIIRIFRNNKPIAAIHPIQSRVVSWKKRKARPLFLGGVTVSSLILEGRGRT